MEAPPTAASQADTWNRQARQNKVIGWALTILGAIALFVGFGEQSMTLMFLAIWTHICGEATLVWAFGLERSAQLLRLLSAREPQAATT